RRSTWKRSSHPADRRPSWPARPRRRSRESGGRMIAESMPTRAETVVAAMAREIQGGDVGAPGVAPALASLALAGARATHAPHLTYLAALGSLDPEIGRLRLSSEDLAYLDGRAGEITIPDLFDHARRGRVDLMFFGAAEVDGRGDTNLTAAGTLE